MKRDFIFIFILLTILSIVNAIPHQLYKRATTFMPCPAEFYSSPLTVSVSPDPLVPGQTAEYTVSGKLAKAAPKGSMLSIGFAESSTGVSKIIGTPFVADICAKTVCPANSINTVEQVPVPADLPNSYVNLLIIMDSAKNIYGCAGAVVASAPVAPKAAASSAPPITSAGTTTSVPPTTTSVPPTTIVPPTTTSAGTTTPKSSTTSNAAPKDDFLTLHLMRIIVYH